MSEAPKGASNTPWQNSGIMPTQTSINIEDLKMRFEEDGFVCLRGILSQQVVDEAKGELEAHVDQLASRMRDNGLITDVLEDEPFETRLYKLYQNQMERAPNLIRKELHWPGMFDLFFNPQVLDLAESILGPEVRLYPNYSCRPKLPDHKATEVLWHQDAGYTATGRHGQNQATDIAVSQLRMVNVWSPLVPARVENGCMQFIPGTHKLGVVPHVDRPHYLEIVEAELKPRLKDAIDIEVDPGDVVLFSNLLFHRGQPNRTKTIRWSCDWRYQDATQPTLREHIGHLARSAAQPDKVVNTATMWTEQHFQ